MAIDLTGMDDILAKLDQLPHALREALKTGAYTEANNVMTLTIPMTPMDNGHLRASKFVSVPVETDESVMVYFGFGGMAQKYAEYQHEGMRADGTHVVRNYTEPDTGSHFLSRGIEKARPAWEERVALHARKALERMAKGGT